MRVMVNGDWLTVATEHQSLSLLEFLRDIIGLMGARYGCGVAQCGACTVLVNDFPVRACLMPISSVNGKSVRTIESLSSQDGENQLHPVQQAFMAENVPQCGYCMSGQIMTLVHLYERNPLPSKSEFIRQLEGHICRCGTYPRIIKVVDRLVDGAQ